MPVADYSDSHAMVPRKEVEPINDLNQLIEKLYDAFETTTVDVDYVQDLLKSYKSNPNDWKQYAQFDDYKYTRNLVSEGNGRFNAMLLCWPESCETPIHDHADAHCFMKILQGELDEIMYHWPEQTGAPPKLKCRTNLSINQSAYINDSIGLHSMANPSPSRRAVSLHIYSPPYSSCHTFDPKTGQKGNVKVTFWSRYGKRTPVTETVVKVEEPSGATVAIPKELAPHREIPQIDCLDRLVAELYSAFESDRVDIDYVQDLLKNYKGNPDEWKKYAKFDRNKYTRNLVTEGNGKFDMMILCWSEGNRSTIHDHSDAHCFMKVLDGRLDEVRFDWPKQIGEPLREKERTSLKTNDISYMNDSIGLHRVENPSPVEPAVSLHVYSPPFQTCHAYDPQTGHKIPVRVQLWSRYGERTELTQQQERGVSRTIA